MAGQPDRRGVGRAGRDPEQAVARLRERADRQIRKLVTGEDWAGWLHVAARLPGWDFTNIMLIAAQRPDATDLAGYGEWQARGRQVRKGESGVAVIGVAGRPLGGRPATSPADRPGRRAGKWDGLGVSRPEGRDAPGQGSGAARAGYVWDVSQTSGPPVQEHAAPLPAQGAPASVWEALTWAARRAGFAVERSSAGGGTASETRWAARRIRISPALDEPRAVQALLHELGHVLAHGDIEAGKSTAGCRGVRRVEADSAAFIAAARLGLDAPFYTWPLVAGWAGSDPRARPEEAVRAAGNRIVAAADLLTAHLDAALAGGAGGRVPAVRAEETEPERDGPGEEEIWRALAEAERFYQRRLAGSWAERYLAGRGLGAGAAARWRAGYAPGEWAALTGHLGRAGFAEEVIEAAGLARRSARGNLIDCFRDRAVLAVRDERGRAAGFIGRARPDAAAGVPKYLNSPQTSVYRKGELLFGLAEGLEALARGAVPVVVEGPFDAIAVTEAGDGRFVGVAPCGTALTGAQVQALAKVAALDRAGVLVALDGDRPGRAGAVRSYQVLAGWTQKLSAAILPAGRDPAEIFERDGAEALARNEPLAQVVIDAHLDEWGDRLRFPEGQLAAMRSAALIIASGLPEHTRATISHSVAELDAAVTVGAVAIADDPKLVEVAKRLPAGAMGQILRVAERTECDCAEVTAEVVNATPRAIVLLKSRAGPIQSKSPCLSRRPRDGTSSPHTGRSFHLGGPRRRLWSGPGLDTMLAAADPKVRPRP